jgi:hypothetical protein
MALDPLKNPLERFTSLPTGMNWRKDPADNLPYWVDTIQYYANDVVLSSVDGGAYVMTGAGDTLPESETVVRGGDDPAADTAGNWISLAPDGVGAANWTNGTAPFTMTPAGAGAITIAGGALVRGAVAAGASEKWLATLTFTDNQSAGGGFVSGDVITATFTPSVAGVAVPVVCFPRLTAAASGMSASAVVTLLPTSTGATLVATYAGVQPSSITNPVITWVRIA